MDEKIKLKQEKLIELVGEFGEEYLDEELTQLSVKLVEKMGRKRDVPFKRGNLDNWASGVIYTIAQLNFLFDASSQFHISADDICNFFGTKKSTARNKANDIRNLLNLNLGNKEFSAESISGLNLSNVGNLNQIKTLKGASRRSRFNDLRELERKLDL